MINNNVLYFNVGDDGAWEFEDEGAHGHEVYGEPDAKAPDHHLITIPKKLLGKLPKNKRLSLSVRKVSEKRSLGVNAYYWAVVLSEFCKEYFGTFLIDESDRFPEAQLEEMHHTLAYQFLKVRSEANPAIEYIRSTSKLTGREFWIYLDQIFALYREAYNGIIPLPEYRGFLPRSETENDKKI